MPDSPVSPAPSARSVPLSLPQQAALSPERLHGARASNVFVALGLPPGLVEAERLDRALAALAQEHEILRTVYPSDRRTPYQRIGEPQFESVLAVPRSEPLADADHCFDLEQGPSVRVKLHRAPDQDVLTVAAHPVAADDQSLDAMVRELLAVYDGARPMPAAQYGAFASGQVRALAATGRDDSDLAYWLAKLAGLPERSPLALASGHSGASGQSVQKGPSRPRRDFFVPGSELGGEGVLAALAAVALSESGLGDDVLIGVVSPAAPDTSAKVALGNFANHLLLRIGIALQDTPRQLVAAVAETTRQAKAHGHVRVEWLVHHMRGPAPLPFQVLMRIRHSAGSEIAVGAAVAKEIARRVARPHGVDIVVDVVLGAAGAQVSVEFPEEISGHPSVDGFTALLRRRFEQWAEAPDAPFSQQPAPAAALFGRTAPTDLYTTGLGGEPRTEAERVVAGVIRQVLELDESDLVGREDTFFALGGDSVSALKAVTLLQGQGYTLDVQKVFESPTICELAEQLVPAGEQHAEAPAEVAPMSASGLDASALAALGKKFSQR